MQYPRGSERVASRFKFFTAEKLGNPFWLSVYVLFAFIPSVFAGAIYIWLHDTYGSDRPVIPYFIKHLSELLSPKTIIEQMSQVLLLFLGFLIILPFFIFLIDRALSIVRKAPKLLSPMMLSKEICKEQAQRESHTIALKYLNQIFSFYPPDIRERYDDMMLTIEEHCWAALKNEGLFVFGKLVLSSAIELLYDILYVRLSRWYVSEDIRLP